MAKKKKPARAKRSSPRPSKPAEREASSGSTVHPPEPPPGLDRDPQDVYDESVSEYESEALRETEVEPGVGLEPGQVTSPPRPKNKQKSPGTSKRPKK